MSIAGYLGPQRPEGLTSGEQLREVLNGKPEDEELSGETVARDEGGEGEFYQGVEDYDPVLRSHCRL